MSDIPAEQPPTLDPIACARWAQWLHVQSPWLNEEVGRRMEDRLQWIRLEPKRWVDWAPVSGGLQAHKAVRARYPKAVSDVVEPTLARQTVAKHALQTPWWQRLGRADSVSIGSHAPGNADMVNVEVPSTIAAGIRWLGMLAALKSECAMGASTKNATNRLTPP